MGVNQSSQSEPLAIQVWPVAQAPKRFRRLAQDSSTWIAYIPAALDCAEAQSLFLRWDSPPYPVVRCRLQDGSIVLAGSNPAAMDWGSVPAAARENLPIAMPAPRIPHSKPQ